MISLIAAIGQNNELGLDNHLIFNIPGDLKFFKNITSGHTVVMGRKTFESIGRKLPNRVNVIVSSSLKSFDDVIVLPNFESVLEKYEKSNEEVFIIGGETLYNYFIDYAKNIYLTEVQKSAAADKYFPSFDKTKYEKDVLGQGMDNDIKYEHVLYRRKNE